MSEKPRKTMDRKLLLEYVRVTEAILTYVAIDESGRPTPIQKG